MKEWGPIAMSAHYAMTKVARNMTQLDLMCKCSPMAIWIAVYINASLLLTAVPSAIIKTITDISMTHLENNGFNSLNKPKSMKLTKIWMEKQKNSWKINNEKIKAMKTLSI